MDLLKQIFDTGDFMSHGHCYLWLKPLVRLHFISDLAIGLAYVFISLTLVYFVRRGKSELPFHWIFLAFGTFIIACGATHFVEVWTLWTPVYWFSGGVKAVTAVASVLTAFILPPLVPKSLALIRSAQLSERRKAELEVAIASLRNEVAERKRAEEEIRKLNEELEKRVAERTAELARANEALAERAAIVQYSHDAIYSKTLDGAIKSWNPGAEKLYGFAAAEIAECKEEILVPVDRLSELEEASRRMSSGEPVELADTARLRKDGKLIDVSVTVSPVKNAEGGIIGGSVIARDITERKRAQAQLQETQKLESLGLIAGGVAHDFNNLLVGILGSASLALDQMPSSSPNHELLQHVVNSSEKAAHLTNQLLAYAGKGSFVVEKLDLSLLIREISGLIQTSIPKSVQIRLELSSSLPPVLADPSQMQQVIMNLVINGAEAIPEGRGGTVLVTTDAQDVDEEYLRNNFAGETAAAGRYVVLEVHDSGRGMSEEVRSKIFDPFFSTKFTGRGLGLAAVLGIVRGHRGMIRVYSIPERGSTFKVLLPAVEGELVRRVAEEAGDVKGAGTILVIDDEEVVRLTARMALERYGYTVLEAVDGRAGTELFRERAQEISAVVLDMMMPVMAGDEAFRRIKLIRPDARIIVSSGYNEVEAVRRFATKGIAAFIQKPYTSAKLAAVIRRVVDGKK